MADSEQFDVLPVLEDDGRIVRLATRVALEAHTSATDWSGFPFDPIYPDDIASATTPLLETLERFSSDRPRLFILGRRHIDGIATIYDLNQPAAHQFGFALALVVEAELGRAIEDSVRTSGHDLDTEVDQTLSALIDQLPVERFPGARNRARSWRRRAQRGDQVRLTRELSFNDKIGLVEIMELAPHLARRCRAPYGASASELIRCLQTEVKALRNAVAHDSGELADEHALWRWMLTTYHMATDLSS